jgi:hypothetical protein
MNNSGNANSRWIVLELLIAGTGVALSAGIAYWQSSQAGRYALAALEQNDQLAHRQTQFSQHLHDLQQWQQGPHLQWLDGWQQQEFVTAIVQNEGGRDVVLYAVGLERTAALTELKHAGRGELGALETVQTAERSKVLPLDLSMKDDSGPMPTFMLDPPAILEPGKTLVLKVKLNPKSPSCRLFVRWNRTGGTGRADVGDFLSLPQQ